MSSLDRSTKFQVSEEDETVEGRGYTRPPRIGITPTMTLTEQLHNCQHLLERAQLAGDADAVRRFSEHRRTLVQQIADESTHTRHSQGSSLD